MSWRCTGRRPEPAGVDDEPEPERCVLHVNHAGLCLFPTDFPPEYRTVAYRRR